MERLPERWLKIAPPACLLCAAQFHVGVVNGPLEQIARDLGFAANKALLGAVVSSTLAGAAIGSLTGGGLADALGRRKAFLLTSLPLLAGPLLCATAADFNQVTLVRPGSTSTRSRVA